MSGMSGGDITTLTGNVGGLIPASGSGNFSIVGTAPITVTGNPVTHTLTISGGGVTGMTEHALAVGNALGNITSLALGITGTVLTGVTGADPAFSASPTLTSVLAGTFDTNVAAAGVTLSGTTLSADGTDVDININITAKGAGQVIIDDLQLGTPLTVPYGGTGAATHTIHGVLIGNAAGAINAVADVTNAGYVLTANVGADPSFQAVPTYTLPTNVPQSFPTDSGTATPALNALTVTGGTNLNSSGAGSTVTLNLDDTITLSTVNATTFDTNVVAAGSTLSGTTWAADGTDANIGMTVTPKGTGALTLTTGDVTISSGNINLPNSTASIGIIKWNGNSYIHNSGYDTSIFAGYEAGRPSGSQGCVGVGYRALKNVDAGGTYNNAFGVNSLSACTSGYYNTGFGQASLYGLTSGYSCIGIGHQAGRRIVSGHDNILIGEDVAYNYTGSESSNICIGNIGSTGESNKIRIGTYGTGTGQQDTAYIAGVVHVSNGMTVDAGNLNLPLSNAGNTSGCIYINGVRYFSANVTAADQMSFGYEAGLGNAGGNFAIGYRALKLDSVGGGNFACGINCLAKINNVNGYYNAAIATGSMQNMTSGDRNCGLGRVSLGTLVSGSNNVGIGDQAGNGYTGSESNNICIGSAVMGTAGESNTIRIGNGTALTHTACYLGGVYGRSNSGTLNIAIIDSNSKLGSTATLAQSYLVNGLTWNNSTSTPVTAAVNNEYTINTAAGLTTINLPATFAVNDRIKIVGQASGGWALVAASGDVIHLDTSDTSAGGSLSSTNRYNCVEVVGTVANSEWVVHTVVGTLTVA